MPIREKEQISFIRNFLAGKGENFDFFLGSGASIQAGIPTGNNLIWEFKKKIYCTENDISQENFKDLQSSTTRNTFQTYFDLKGNFPKLYDSSEYSFYFKKCYDSELARKQFIQTLVENILPSHGHLCLAHLFINKKISSIWTTNFDELVEAGIKTLNPPYAFNVVSSMNASSIKNIKANTYQCVYKLHGDYRYDNIKNTSLELQTLESSISSIFKNDIRKKGLVVIGYSGSDDSIMNVLEENISSKDFLQNGLYWLKPSGSKLSGRVNALMERACAVNSESCVVNIDSFDEFLNIIYKNLGIRSEIIDSKALDLNNRKKDILFSSSSITNDFIKTNTFIAETVPLCNAFKTDIKSWEELRKIAGNELMVGLYNGYVYSFETKDKLKEVFGRSIKSDDIEQAILPEADLYKNNSVYMGLLYQLILRTLLQNDDIAKFSKNKIYFRSSKTECDFKYFKYDAVELTLSYINNKYYLSILPTVYVTHKNGQELDKLEKQFAVNKIMSSVYNSRYNERLVNFHRVILKDKLIEFHYNEFILNFVPVYISCGGVDRKKEWPSLDSHFFQEPEMLFSASDTRCKGVNQLKGLLRYGPIDYSFTKSTESRHPIRLAVLSPSEDLSIILKHLNLINQKHAPKRAEKEGFIPNYEGFADVYKKAVTIPANNDANICRTYNGTEILKHSTADFVDLLKSQIDYFSTKNSEFDLLVIYIPRKFVNFREDKRYYDDFNLHDAIKLYANDKGIKVQFIEDKSVSSYDDCCKVMWGLTTSIYAKASGVLWHPAILQDNTVFIGISYAISENKGTCIGCSQLFDSTGTGVRLILKKLNDPRYIGKNPYMKEEEAFTTLSKLREEYYKSNPTGKLQRVVVHKTTPFTKEEIKGFTKALEGIEDIELLQIQEHSSWRAIRMDQNDIKKACGYAVKRGLVFKIDNDSFLLWSHGCLNHAELLGEQFNYYKGGRGIPSPLLIRRFYGKASGDTIVKEILMLTKMNWNSGDSLYKIMPVTLDFAKVLARMSKQNEAVYNKSYDFRYFM